MILIYRKMKAKCAICMRHFYTSCSAYSTNDVFGKYIHICNKCLSKEETYINKMYLTNELINNVKINIIKEKLPYKIENVIKAFM